MRTGIVALAVFAGFALAGAGRAQGFAEGLAAAQQRIDAQQWGAALAALLDLRPQAASDAELEELGRQLHGVGRRLLDGAVFEPALRAHEAALALRRRLHGEADHADVAASLNQIGFCLRALGRSQEAMPHFDESLAIHRRVYGDGDHSRIAASLNNLASCLESLGRSGEALPRFQAALAMNRHLNGDHDGDNVAVCLLNVAGCMQSLGRTDEALLHFDAGLAMFERLYPDQDHPQIAATRAKQAACLHAVGRAREAWDLIESALAMQVRLYRERDHLDVALSLNMAAACLGALGRAGEALEKYWAALAMFERLSEGRDDPRVAMGLCNVAAGLRLLGRTDEALPYYEMGLAMQRRVYAKGDHPEVASSLTTLAGCLQALGRTSEALPQYEASLAMFERLYPASDHPLVALSLNNVAYCLQTLGRTAEALQHHEAALAMQQRSYAGGVHPDVATSLNNLASCLHEMGRRDEALSRAEAALAMQRLVYGDRDHRDVTSSLNNIGGCLGGLGRLDEALPQFEASLAMRRRLYGDRDHPDVAASLNVSAFCLESLGRANEALPRYQQAVGMIERLRDASRVSADLRQSMFDEFKQGGMFERLQVLTARLGMPAETLLTAERSRGRGLLDLLEQQRFDPLDDAVRRAQQLDDEALLQRLQVVRDGLASVGLESDRLLHELTLLDDGKLGATELESRRTDLIARSNAVALQQRQFLDDRARLLGDVLPVGRVCTVADIQRALQPGEVFLEFTITKAVQHVCILSSEGDVEVLPLPAAFAATEQALPVVLASCSRGALAPERGRDPDSPPGADETPARARELFAGLVPAALWERIRGSKRVFVAAHRCLHRVPFELLVVDQKDGKPVYWLDVGPEVAYVPSGSALHWLRQRERVEPGQAGTLELLAVGDPKLGNDAPQPPAQGVLVQQVNAGGEAARVGIQPFDVLTSYDDKPLADDAALRDVRTATEAAIREGKRPASPIPIDLWRNGATLRVETNPGLLGILVGKGAARGALEASLDRAGDATRFVHKSDLERIARLKQLRGARAEAESIAAAFRAHDAKAELLLGAEATEPVIADLAAKARYLHFACHGIAEEYAGQSLSMLVLSQPQRVQPGDDGLLKFSDLLHTWRGRLSSCRLVVLSACSTNVGPTGRDEAPQALPIGFLLAGAPSVICSLWAVDDASTRELMTDFYGRLLAGETDKLAAFTAAKKALRQKYPHPFHWAPFLFVGVPH